MRFVINRRKAIEQYNKLKGLGVQVSYSVKTNPLLTSVLEEKTDSMFSIHNPKNLELVKDKSRVWFFPQAWSHDQIQGLLKKGVNHFVVDNENDLKVLVEFLKKSKNNLSLLLRMRLREHTIFTGRYYVFGMPSEVINEWIPKLAKIPNIKGLGVHFHRKSQNVSEWRLTEELRTSLTEQTLQAIQLVDIGGGFPAEYKNTTDAIMSRIVKDIEELKIWVSKYKIKIIAEPGRFIAAPAGRLEVRIINIYENNIIVDGSVYSGAMDTLVVPIKLVVEGEKESGNPYTIKGISPCSLDIFRYRVFLKRKLKIGDTLVFLNAGAYNYYSDFCSLDRPETVLVN